jgi:hypothetical protein
VHDENKVYAFDLIVVDTLSKALEAIEAGLSKTCQTGCGGQNASDPVRVSLIVSTEIRNIAACAYERDGKRVFWESDELKEFWANEKPKAEKDKPHAGGRGPKRRKSP